MGYLLHHAIVVTLWRSEAAEPLRDACAKAYAGAGGNPNAVSAVTPELKNGQRSFAIFPDGSKEGWEDSDKGDAGRVAVKAVLRASDDYPSWVEMTVGGDDDLFNVVDSSASEGGAR